jgi:hypothetical protein
MARYSTCIDTVNREASRVVVEIARPQWLEEDEAVTRWNLQMQQSELDARATAKHPRGHGCGRQASTSPFAQNAGAMLSTVDKKLYSCHRITVGISRERSGRDRKFVSWEG